MTRKYSELLNFTNTARAYRKGGKEAKTKFEYALDKMSFRIVLACKELETEIKEKISDARMEFASTDDKKNIIIGENGNYVYTTKNALALENKIREISRWASDTEIKIEPYIPKEVPVLTEFQVADFKGIVIPEDYEVPEPDDLPNTNHVTEPQPTTP